MPARRRNNLTAFYFLALLAAGSFAPSRLPAQNVTLAPTITTVAGNGSAGYNGDNIPATSAELNGPSQAVTDALGNLYITDHLSFRIRKVNSGGTISTVAGTSAGGYNGDNIAATSSELYYPFDATLDTAGNLYIADQGNQRVRKVSTSGLISTIAGNGTAAYNGDNIAATSAELYEPTGIALDNAGNLYIADYGNNRVRKVNSSGIITTVAGTGTAGYNGDNIAATSAEINGPTGVAADSAGNIYIVELGGERIRKVSSAGTISTVAGTGTAGYNGDNIPATSAQINNPYKVAVDSGGDLYIADYTNQRIRKVNAAGTITTIAGTGTAGYSGDNGAATLAELSTPIGVTLDADDNLYIADYGNQRVRKISAGNVVNFGQITVGTSGTQTVILSINNGGTLASVSTSGDYTIQSNSCPLNTTLDAGTLCTLQVKFTPTKPGQRSFPLVVTDNSGNKYSFGLEGVAVTSALAFTPGIISTVAGNGYGAGSQGDTGGYSGDGGPAISAEFNSINDVKVDSAGNLYLADTNNQRIRKVDISGVVNTIAGNGTDGYSGDNGPATSAELNGPLATTLDSAGNLYIGDSGNSSVRKVDVSGTITTVAGTGIAGYNGDGIAATSAELSGNEGLTFDEAGNLYIADTFNDRVRKVDTNGIMTTVAGMGEAGYNGDNIPATSAELSNPVDVHSDASGNLFIADVNNFRIRKVNTSGVITTVAGTGTQGYSGDGGPATSAEIGLPLSLSFDSAGNLYFADGDDNVVRMVSLLGTINTVAGNGYGAQSGGVTGGYAGDGGPATNAEFDLAAAASVDGMGNIYIADTYNNVVRQVNVSRSAVTFPITPVAQTSATQTIAVSDVGTAALDFISITASSNFTLESPGGSCAVGTPLAVGATCNIGVAFAPTTTGNPITGTLTVADDAVNSPQTATLSGTTSVTGTAPAITSENSATFVIGTVGTFTVTTTGSPTPSITESGTLPSGLTFIDNGNGTGTLSGTPSAIGTFQIVFTASNGVSPNAIQNFTVTVGTTSSSFTKTYQLGGGIRVACCQSGMFYGFTAVLQDTSLSGAVEISSISVSDSANISATDPNGVAGTTWEVFIGPASCGFPVGNLEGAIAVGTYTCNAPTQLIVNTNDVFTAPTSGAFSAAYNYVTGAFTGSSLSAFVSGSTAATNLPQGLFIQVLLWGGDQGADLTLNNISVTVTGTQTVSSQNQTLGVTLRGDGAAAVTGFANDTQVINCGESSGVTSSGNTCSASLASGTMVTLTATPVEGSGSTFGGWGGACSDFGTSPTCNVTMSGAQTVSANFIAAPQSVQLAFTPGTNVVQTAAFDCPGNPNPITPANPCTPTEGPNANAFEVMLPQVYTAFTMVVTATELQGDGLCPAGGSVSDPTDFDCRFKTFFNYGTDTNGNTIVPLCYPYSNGNCVHYDIYYCVPQTSGPCVPTPGQEPPPSYYLNLVNLKTSWNNDTFAPPGPYYTASLPRFYDDPDYAFTPTSPYGTICGDPMVSGTTMEPYSCQFEFDVTTFFDPTAPVDATIGGTIRQFNDLVVAFPPTTAGTSPVVTPTVPSAPAISGSCVTGCTVVTAGGSSSVMFTVGVGGSFALTATGYPAPLLTETGTLPTGLTFSTSTGTISGTPAAGTNGSYPISIKVANAVGSVTQNFTVVVSNGVSASTLKISPAAVNFGNVYLDTIAAREITLTNTGTASISILKVSVTAAASSGIHSDISISSSKDFVVVNLCGKTLRPNKSCVVIVSFVAAGDNFSPQSATLAITDSAAGSPQSVPLTAAIINPRVHLSPLSINFGNQPRDTTSAVKSLTLTNSGNTPLDLSGLVVSGNFAIASGTTCFSSTTLEAGAHCVIDVTFKPTSAGPKTGSVKISDNALVGSQFVFLTGNGT